VAASEKKRFECIRSRLPNRFLADPSCLCLQEVVSEVQRNESRIHAHFDGYSFINWNVGLEAAII